MSASGSPAIQGKNLIFPKNYFPLLSFSQRADEGRSSHWSYRGSTRDNFALNASNPGISVDSGSIKLIYENTYLVSNKRDSPVLMYDCGEGARRHDHNHPHRVSGHSHADDNQYDGDAPGIEPWLLEVELGPAAEPNRVCLNRLLRVSDDGVGRRYIESASHRPLKPRPELFRYLCGYPA